MRVAIRFAAACAALVLPSAAAAAIVEEFRAVDWEGVAYTNDGTGEFTHCTVFAKYENGATLFFSYDVKDLWYLGVMDERWTLSELEDYDITFKVDRHGEVKTTGTAYNTTEIEATLSADDPLVGQVRNGDQLTVNFQDSEYAFELSNSSKAMSSAQDCVRRHVELGTTSPVEESTASEPAKEESPELVIHDGEVIGMWEASPIEDKDGNFVNCTAYGNHGDDQLILSYFPDGVWTFGLYRGAWNLDTNQTYYLWYNVDAPADAEGVIKRPVEAATPQRIFFEVSELEDIIERIESGATLNLQFRGLTGDPEELSYPLERAAEAFAATRQCVSERAPSEPVAEEGTATEGEEVAPGSEESTATESPEATAISEPRRELPQLGSKLVEEFEVPGWKAAAFSLDDDTFTHCAIKAEYQNGATLGVARAAGGDLVLAIQHGDWSLATDTWVPISYSIPGDTSLSVLSEGHVSEDNLILTNIGGGDELAETLKSARAMTIEAEGKNLDFDISDIAPGIEAIDACVERHEVASVEPAPEAGAGTEPEAASLQDTSPDQAAIRTEAAGFTTALLLRSGYPNHVILPKETSDPEPESEVDAKWQLGEVEGTTSVLTSGTPGEIESDVGGSYADQCDGVLSTLAGTSDETHSHFTLVCEGSKPWTTQFVVLPRDTGGSYLFAIAGKGDDTEEEAIAKAVYAKAVGG